MKDIYIPDDMTLDYIDISWCEFTRFEMTKNNEPNEDKRIDCIKTGDKCVACGFSIANNSYYIRESIQRLCPCFKYRPTRSKVWGFK